MWDEEMTKTMGYYGEVVGYIFREKSLEIKGTKIDIESIVGNGDTEKARRTRQLSGSAGNEICMS